MLGVVILENLRQVKFSADLTSQQLKQGTMFVHLCQEGLTLNDPNNCLQGDSPHQCGRTFGIGIFSVVSMCAKTMQDKSNN